MADLIVHKNSLLPVRLDGEVTFFCTISTISQPYTGRAAPEVGTWSDCRVRRIRTRWPGIGRITALTCKIGQHLLRNRFRHFPLEICGDIR